MYVDLHGSSGETETCVVYLHVVMTTLMSVADEFSREFVNYVKHCVYDDDDYIQNVHAASRRLF